MVNSKRSAARRAARLMQMGAGLAGSYLAYQLRRPFLDDESAHGQRQELRRKQARRVRVELQQLRGPVMKLGQALSMQTHFLGTELVEELSALQMHAPPMHPTLMRAQFKAALGDYPEKLFRSFEDKPFAAASLGQVHWAVTRDGEEVAVKIQYPAMREAIKGDFVALRAAILPVRLSGHLEESVVREVERGILEETDYLNEARNIEFFRKALAPLSFISVPKVYPNLSSDRVLTMSRVDGVRLTEFLKTNPPREVRDKLGCNLARLFFYQLFRVQALHADPHPGNYLLNRDGTIGLVDFGCVKYLKPEVVGCYGQFWSREWVRDAKIYAEIIRIVFGHKASPEEPRIRRCMNEIRKFYDKFHPLDDGGQPLDIGDPKFMDALGELAKTIVATKFLSPEFIFLSRTESGMCSLLHILKARVPTTQIARQWMPSKPTE
ncbi:MAG TPA: AarF/ABC1/UbiB kinase family protein [Candidatus Baltobacteraceae bacterium]|jgi:predicted unusual protein kinase regulating ubiquinone biosynthesis (AarF/ABC1/UbiB family)|nr:AarF/ABC1/UbiB kinase family protein [Candidatus Baltobacteraceae bacterium]